MSIPTADTLRIMALTRKPRTTSEIAAALGVSAATAGQWLATLAGKGRIHKAEKHLGAQIWEAAQ